MIGKPYVKTSTSIKPEPHWDVSLANS